MTLSQRGGGGGGNTAHRLTSVASRLRRRRRWRSRAVNDVARRSRAKAEVWRLTRVRKNKLVSPTLRGRIH